LTPVLPHDTFTCSYLNDFSKGYKGGEFIFNDGTEEEPKYDVVEPRRGRVLLFTSGSENVHRVAQLTSGVRYALTVAFTCDKDKALGKVIAMEGREEE
jgi:predicted 2-oxoglutarate/Fe(II)-dependent dioxygenase YbiX